MIGIIGAMDIEVKTLISLMKNTKSILISNIKYTKGKLEGADCVIAKSGVGKVNSAVCAQTMILNFLPRIIINTGVAGGINDKINVGDVVISDYVIQHDFDTSALGGSKGMISGIDLIKIPCSKMLIEKIFNNNHLYSNIKLYKGTILTGDQFIDNKNILTNIKNKFNGCACDMESGSIGHVCYINNIDFVSIRSISDTVNKKLSHLDYNEFKENSADNASIVTKALFKNIKL